MEASSVREWKLSTLLYPGGQYGYADGGGEGLLDYRDYAMQAYAEPPSEYMDLGTPDFTSWVTATEKLSRPPIPMQP